LPRGVFVSHNAVWQFLRQDQALDAMRAQKRTIEDARTYIGALLATITPSECKNYFQNDGYGSIKA
jgi:hypothetical protein